MTGCARPERDIAPYFPAPVIMSLGRCLRNDEKLTLEEPPKGGWANWKAMTGDGYGELWSPGLQSLSGTCVFMRNEMWGMSLKVLRLKSGEDLDRLEDAIPVRWRKYVQ